MQVGASTTDAAPGGPDAGLQLRFAGVRFDFRGPSALLQQLEGVPCAHRRTEEAPEGSPFSEPLLCEVSTLESAPDDPESNSLGVRTITWSWQGARATILNRHAWAELLCGATGHRARARLAPTRHGAESLLTGLSAAMLHRGGGAILHAASIELRGSVIALIGPSGAGKSTVGRQLEGGLLFSVDRLAVCPTADGCWLAFPMPGGTRSPLDGPPSSCAEGPLRAILRVRKAAAGQRIEPCPAPQVVALLRQSAFHSGRDSEGERNLLAHLERLAAEVPVANLHSSLGTKLGGTVSRWIEERGPLERPPSGRPFHDESKC